MRSFLKRCVGILLVILGAGAGCERSGVRSFDVRGVVKEVRATNAEVVIRHEEIPGYMAAMTMPFDVKDASLLDSLKTGDVVRFRLHVEPKDSWADSFVVLSNAGPASVAPEPAPVLNDPTAVSFYKDVPELKVGDTVPDYVFTNHLGARVRLEEFRGRVLVFNFFFTRCPLPDFCPRETDNLAATMRRLKAEPASGTNWHFLSLSFEPEIDTPGVLERYARNHGYDPAWWTFATGSYDQLQPLGSHFGLYFARQVTPDNQNHNLRTVVLDPKGRVSEIIIGNRWTPTQLVEAIRKAQAAP